MPAIDLTDDQAVELFSQLPVDRRLSVLRALARQAAPGREERMAFAEGQIRMVCKARGLEWERMTEEQREALMNDLVHERRACGR